MDCTLDLVLYGLFGSPEKEKPRAPCGRKGPMHDDFIAAVGELDVVGCMMQRALPRELLVHFAGCSSWSDWVPG